MCSVCAQGQQLIVLAQATLQHSAPLLEQLKDPSLRSGALRLLRTLLLGYQHSKDAFHALLPQFRDITKLLVELRAAALLAAAPPKEAPAAAAAIAAGSASASGSGSGSGGEAKSGSSASEVTATAAATALETKTVALDALQPFIDSYGQMLHTLMVGLVALRIAPLLTFLASVPLARFPFGVSGTGQASEPARLQGPCSRLFYVQRVLTVILPSQAPSESDMRTVLLEKYVLCLV